MVLGSSIVQNDDAIKADLLQEAWDLVLADNVSLNTASLTQFLNDVGADDISSFELLVQDIELLDKLYSFLKPLKKKKLSILLKGVCM